MARLEAIAGRAIAPNLSTRFSDRQNNGVDVGARMGERSRWQVVPFPPTTGRAAPLHDFMQGPVPLVLPKFGAGAHHSNKDASRFQKLEGVADMIAIAGLSRSHSYALLKKYNLALPGS